MNFEYNLKQKLQKEILEQTHKSLKGIIEEFMIKNTRTYSYNNMWTEVLSGIEDLMFEYAENYKNLTPEQLPEIFERFCESVSNESLNEMKKDIKLTEEEERYIIYENIKFSVSNRISPISQILLRRKLLEFLKEYMEIDKSIEILKKDSGFFINQRGYIYELLTGGFFKSEEQLQNKLEEEVEILFNQRINCGGYALELDTRIFNFSNDFEKAVSELLNKVPFIRLLGDKKLKDDEYLVIWKVHEEGGHHFVKVQEDGTVFEKDGGGPIKIFSSWSQSLNECPEAIFAVKKEHNMYLAEDNFKLITISGEEGLNFEETVQQAVQKQSNSFEYHNHSYYFKKNENGNVYICSEDKIVADAIIENNECLIDIIETEKKYISNTQPTVPLYIKDGKIQNNDIIEER